MENFNQETFLQILFDWRHQHTTWLTMSSCSAAQHCFLDQRKLVQSAQFFLVFTTLVLCTVCAVIIIHILVSAQCQAGLGSYHELLTLLCHWPGIRPSEQVLHTLMLLFIIQCHWLVTVSCVPLYRGCAQSSVICVFINIRDTQDTRLVEMDHW